MSVTHVEWHVTNNPYGFDPVPSKPAYPVGVQVESTET